MKNLSKTALAISFALGLSACGGSSSTDKTVTPPPPPAPIKTAVSGKAIKGTMFNAIVTVYKFIDNKPVALTSTEVEEANITTDDKGNYSFTLLDYTGPVKVELSVSADTTKPTTMVCDAPAGCGATAFSETIDLTATDPNFTLSSISVVDTDSKGAITTNVSALTHLASILIESSDAGISAETVQEKSSLIANTFRIEGNITQLEPTAVEDAANVVAEDNSNELRYGIINAGIMSALFSGETNNTEVLSTKFAAISKDITESNGSFLVNQDADNEFELALADVFTGASETASALATAIAADDSLTDTEAVISDLNQIETNLENEIIAEEALADENGRSQVGTDIPTDGDNIAKAKAMAEDVRLFANLFDVTGQANQDIKSQGDAYLQLTSAAGTMIEGEAASFTLLAELSDVIANLGLQNEAGTLVGTTFSIEDLLSGSNAIGTITFDPENLIFKVDATSGVQAVKLNIDFVFADNSRSVNLNFDGMLESANAQLVLAEGSKAIINVDADISKEALQSDTFTGKITSGELNFSVSLMQKTTDTITNPVTFTGILSTTLKPVGINQLDEKWVLGWVKNNDGQWEQKNHAVYGRPFTETAILPEMINFSGDFSALAGDSVTAALTVNINDLDSYQAPKFQYIGKEIPNVMSYNLSDDHNTFNFNETDLSVNNLDQTFIFEPTEIDGQWHTRLITDGNTNSWAHLYHEDFYTKVADYGYDKPGFNITYVWDDTTKEPTDTQRVYGAEAYKVMPIDDNSDNIVDYYSVITINSYDSQVYDRAHLVNNNGELLLADGTIKSFDTARNVGEYDTVELFTDRYSWIMPSNPLSISSAAKFAASYIEKLWSASWIADLTDQGSSKIFFNQESLSALANNDVSQLPTSGYLTNSWIKDALKVTVSEDAQSVDTTYVDGSSLNFSYQGEINNYSVAEVINTSTYTINRNYWVTTTTEDKTLVQLSTKWQDNDYSGSYAFQAEFTPVDQDNDGITDGYTSIYLQGDHLTDTGQLVDENNEPVTLGWTGPSFATFDNVDWLNDGGEVYFNPRNTSNALEFFKTRTANRLNSSSTFHFDNIGELKPIYTMDEINALTAGSTASFDMLNTQADSTSAGIENEDVFLKGNAALSLDLMLGEYQVGLQLSGERTAFKDAKFDLAMHYKLPNDSAQRSFSVHANTEQDNTVSMSNAEDVHVTLTKISDDAQSSGESVLGNIMVGTGDNSIEVAQIVDRDGVVLIVYSDGSVESL